MWQRECTHCTHRSCWCDTQSRASDTKSVPSSQVGVRQLSYSTYHMPPFILHLPMFNSNQRQPSQKKSIHKSITSCINQSINKTVKSSNSHSLCFYICTSTRQRVCAYACVCMRERQQRERERGWSQEAQPWTLFLFEERDREGTRQVEKGTWRLWKVSVRQRGRQRVRANVSRDYRSRSNVSRDYLSRDYLSTL